MSEEPLTESPIITRLLIALSARKCRGCDDPSFHTHHLTLLGKWRYIWRWHRRDPLRGHER